MNSPRIVIAGAVNSTRRTLEALVRHGANLVGVLELSQEVAAHVSGYCRLLDVAKSAGVPCVQFQDINRPETVAQIRQWQPDVLFVVGLSQLVKRELLALPRLGCVGFHPTKLPRGRGRAPIAWLVLDGVDGAATFFQLDEGADSGPIFVQEPFPVLPIDYAADVIGRMELAMDVALDRWLPQLLAGRWEPKPQDDRQATYNSKRTPEDGLLDWQRPAEELHALIRAASRPHPGAYTYYRRQKLIVWRAELESSFPIRGVPGRVVHTDPQRGSLVQTGRGLLWLTEAEISGSLETNAPQGKLFAPPMLAVGTRLGLVVEEELRRLQQQLESMNQRIAELQNRLDGVSEGVRP